MAVKARAEITLSSIRDVQSVTRYYLLQSSTSAVPSKPTTNPPGGDWVTSEPTYTSGSTNSLYFVDLTVFSDGTFTYSDVSLSSSYEAAKVAYNKAENAEDIAERATHSINLTPFGSRSFDDTDYWKNGFSGDGYTSSGTVWNTEQLSDGWIHFVCDTTGYTGTAVYSGDAVRVAKSQSIKPDTLYTILYEVRNNNSVLSSSSGNNSYFYIQEARSNQFWGNATSELLEGTGTSGSFVLRTMAPEQNTVYRKRFTKMSDAGTNAGSSPTGLFQMMYRTGKGDILDFEFRVSLYEGRYLGDYMPYVISDTTDIEADISAANALAQSAKDTADGKITTFYAASTATPTATTGGDLWIKTDDGNSLWRWDGTSWVSVDNADIQKALTDAGNAQATADSKVVTFAQTDEPTATDVGDIWIDTDDNNHMYRWNGTAWVDIHDPQIAEANEKIDNLEVGGRNLIINTLYPSTTNRPKFKGQVGPTAGRGTAFVAEHGFRAQLASSINWQYIYFGSSAIGAAVDMLGLEPGETCTFSADASFKLLSSETGMANATTYEFFSALYYSKVTSGSFSQADKNVLMQITQTDKGVEHSLRIEHTFTVPSDALRLYYCVRSNCTTTSHYATGDFIELRNIKLEKGSKASDWTPAPEDLENAITTSQETADGKNTVYYQNSAPTNQTFKTNDIWFDTDNENKMYHWNGSTWTAAPFGNAAFSNIDAGKVTTGTMSANRIKGDTLTLGGANNADGMLKVYDANGTLVGSFTREGLMAIAGTIGGWIINSSELTGEWQETYQHFESLLSPVSGLQFEETSTEPGFDAQFLNSIWYGTAGISFLRRRTVNNAVEQSSAFISADTNGGWDGSGREGQITISPHLRVDGTGIDTPHMRADASYAWNLASGSYIRQPAMIMSGSTTISTGTSSKRATICTIPVEYQTGWRIIPFVTRTYGNSEATPADAGDFYYAYYNSADHKVCVKLANVLASGTAYTFDYMIYAVPLT